jgi:hypothetical protein
MLALNLLILALGVFITFLACFAMFIEEAFFPRAPMIPQDVAKPRVAHDPVAVKLRKRTAHRNRPVPWCWESRRQVSIRHQPRTHHRTIPVQ